MLKNSLNASLKWTIRCLPVGALKGSGLLLGELGLVT